MKPNDTKQSKMKLSATSWSFPYCTLKEITGILKALGIEAVDLGFFYSANIGKVNVDLAGTVDHIRDTFSCRSQYIVRSFKCSPHF